jgi:uncharacterized protein with HEPN domain
MKKNDHLESQQRLQHIVAAIDKIEEFGAENSFESFSKSALVQSAILFQFLIIGEAINHVEVSKLEKYSYPWYKVRSFRNFIAHEYFQIKHEAVWNIIIDELPGLKIAIEEVLQKEF